MPFSIENYWPQTSCQIRDPSRNLRLVAPLLDAIRLRFSLRGFSAGALAVFAIAFAAVAENRGGSQNGEARAFVRDTFVLHPDHFPFNFHSNGGDRLGQFRKKECEAYVGSDGWAGRGQDECTLLAYIPACSAPRTVLIVCSPPEVHPGFHRISHIRPLLSNFVVMRRASPFGRTNLLRKVRRCAHVEYFLTIEATTVGTKSQEYESHTPVTFASSRVLSGTATEIHRGKLYSEMW